MYHHIIWFKEVGINDIEKVGGKNASLGEMIQHLTPLGVKVPTGFATLAQSYKEFLSQNNLDQRIQQALSQLDINNIHALSETAKQIRQWIIDTPFSDIFISEIKSALEIMRKEHGNELTVAVRSSATAEDLPEASFAGQQETFLNVRGDDQVLLAIKQVFASLFTDRAIVYRQHHHFAHEQVALSVGVQRMVRSDIAASGVIFTLDTESGFKEVVFITAAYGLGEAVVQGAVNPDEFYVHKPTLLQNRPAILRRSLGSKLIKMIYTQENHFQKATETKEVSETDREKFCLLDAEIQKLARTAILIEKHYGKPMDIEWGKDGIDGELYILQARPETVKAKNQAQTIERYSLQKTSKILVEGRSIGQKIGQGTAKVLRQLEEMHRIQDGDVLIADMTDPDWEPIMKRCSAIVTNRGGRTCHAAIIARELGIPAVVGCGDATQRIMDGSEVTVSCAQGDTGFIYEGLLPFTVNRADLNKMPKIPVKLMLNVGNPFRAFDFSALPNEGVGLARLEFIINQMIGIHPKALLNYQQLPNDLKKQIDEKIKGYAGPVEYYIERLKEGIASIAAAFSPKPVIVRLSDFKSNEYANLMGGQLYEPKEENPMLGFRGASRYISPEFQDCFELECRALKRVRDEMGLENVQIMVPFVRTLTEAKQVIDLLAQYGFKRGENNLKIIMMCELPSNALLATEFLEYFDGFSIGSNDLTQLTLGLDRDSGIIAKAFDERNPAVKILLQQAIIACKKAGKYIGICGQGPSDYPDLAQWLLEQKIESMSLNPDSVIETWLLLSGER